MGKVAFVFPGQGAQFVGMGKEFAENLASCKDVFDIADKELGFELSKLCFEGSEEELNKTENTQPAILTTSIAALMALKEKGINCDVVAGLSLGEYTALVCSGAMEFKDAVKLVKKRGSFMQQAVSEGVGTMAAILGLEADKVQEACTEASIAGVVEIANLNCPGQIVIAGEIKAVELALEKVKEKGAKKAKLLSVSVPAHTSMLKPAADKLAKELEEIDMKEFNIPIITNVTGNYLNSKEEIKPTLKKQVMSSVLWENTIRTMIKDGVDTFIEIGPGKTLSAFVKKVDRKMKILNIQDMQSLKQSLEQLRAD